MAKRPAPTGVERYFDPNDIIVSKTDLKGRITYVNSVFEDISGYSRQELIGQPHSIIRHPYMPRAIFRLFWGCLERGDEIFAYVKNICSNGDHYWVLAHGTPSFDMSGNVIAYHSNRRCPNENSVREISRLYDRLLAEEAKHANARAAADAGYNLLDQIVKEETKSGTYSEWIWQFIRRTGEYA